MGWSIVDQYIEDEKKILSCVDPLNTIFHGVLLTAPWYSNKNCREKIRESFQNLYSSFKDLVKITAEGVNVFPACEKELEIMKEMKKSINYSEEILEKPSILFYFGKLVDIYSDVLIYLNYRKGFNSIREECITEKKSPAKIFKENENLLFSFERKWDKEFYVTSKERSTVTYFIADALNNTVFEKVLKSPRPEEILKKEIPEKGLRRLMGKSIEEDVSKKLKNPKKNCYINNLRRKAEREEFKNYIHKLKILTMEYVR